MTRYALSILFTFILISLNAQISQYQFSVQTKPYVSLEGGINLTANFTAEDWQEYYLTIDLPDFINFEFDQKVFCPAMVISFDGFTTAYCLSEDFEDEYEVTFAPHSSIMDYRFSGGADSLDTEIWYKFEDGVSYLEYRNLSFYDTNFNEISPEARFHLTYIFDHETGSFQYHYGPASYNPAINNLLSEAEYVLGAVYFKETQGMNSDFAVIMLSGNPANPIVNIFENGNEPTEDYFMNAIPAEGTLYQFTLNPNSTSNFNTILTEYSVVPNPGNNEAILNNELQSISADLSIWNVNGQLMHQTIVHDKANIDTSTFPSGMYFFQVTTEKGTQTIKWMKN